MTWLREASARVVARWTLLYTAGLPGAIRDRRREEIGADVHGQLEEARSRGEPGLSLRNSADRQPLRLAARAAGQLASGSQPATVLPPVIDMASDPAPFIIVFDSRHHVLATSGHLNGGTPRLPDGVLAWVAAHGQDRITWQPGSGLREAAVIEPYGGLHPGFVLAAQSLQGVSGLQRSLTRGIGYIWLAGLGASLLIVRPRPARRRPVL